MTDLFDHKHPHYSPSHERKAATALSDHAYKAAFDEAADLIKEGPKLRTQIVRIEERQKRAEIDSAQIDVLQGSVRELRGKLAKLQAAVPARSKSDQKTVKPAKMLAVAAVAALRQKAGHADVEQTIVHLLPHDQFRSARDMTERLTKSATDAATTTNVGWAAELVSSVTSGFWRDEQSPSVYGLLQRFAPPLTFGNENSLIVPHRPLSSEGRMKPAWVEENASIPVVADALNSTTLNRFKLAAISAFSDHILRSSPHNVSQIIEASLIDDLRREVDAALLDNAAATPGLRPAGLLNNVNPQTSAGNDLTSILTDLRYLRAEMTAIRARKPVMILHPDRVAALGYTESGGLFPLAAAVASGELMGMTLIVSANAPEDQVICVDTASLLLASDLPEIDLTQHASLVMVNADTTVAPSMGGSSPNSVDEAGSIHVSDAAGTVPTSEVRSMFQTDAHAMRLVAPVAWGQVRVGVAFLNGVGW